MTDIKQLYDEAYEPSNETFTIEVFAAEWTKLWQQLINIGHVNVDEHINMGSHSNNSSLFADLDLDPAVFKLLRLIPLPSNGREPEMLPFTSAIGYLDAEQNLDANFFRLLRNPVGMALASYYEASR